MAYGIDYEKKTATLFDEGTQKFNTTTMASVADALVGILRAPAQFSNKTVFVHDFYTTQREILSIIEEETNPDGTKFSTTSLDLEAMGKRSLEALGRGEYIPQNIFGAIAAAVWGKEGAADWDENDDSVATGLVKKDLRVEIKKKLEAGR